jgi:glycosyltransferase involved in cell wall biosynthesis
MISTIIAPAPARKKHIDLDYSREKKVSYTKTRVSAVIITYNEEKIIRKTLSKLYWCDEIIIVDSHSTDNTVAICHEFGCQVYLRSFDGYGPQKQFAVSKANNDWLLCVDADEVLSDELVKEIIDSFQAAPDCSGFSFPMNLVFLNKEFVHGKESGRHFLRLFNKQKGDISSDKVHESLRVEGTVKKLHHTIRHYSYTSLHQCVDKLNRYSSLSAEMAFKKGKKKSAWTVLFGLPFNFCKYFFLERNFMNGWKGFYWSLFSTYYHFSKHVKLKELHQNQ